MTEKELGAHLERWLREDNVDFQPLYDHFFPLLWLYIRWKFRYPVHVCQDIAHDALIGWWCARQANRLGTDKDKAVAYLYTIARNLAIDHHRKAAYHREDRSGDVTELCPNARAKGLNPEATAIIKNLLEQLDEIPREIVILKYLTGLKGKEIAEILNTTDGNVGRICSDAKARLRELLTGKLEKRKYPENVKRTRVVRTQANKE